MKVDTRARRTRLQDLAALKLETEDVSPNTARKLLKQAPIGLSSCKRLNEHRAYKNQRKAHQRHTIGHQNRTCVMTSAYDVLEAEDPGGESLTVITKSPLERVSRRDALNQFRPRLALSGS